MICSAEWVLFAAFGDDWIVRLTIRGLRFAHPRLSIVRRLRRRMLERFRSPMAEAWQAAFGDACWSGFAHPRRRHGRPPSATHVGAVMLSAILRRACRCETCRVSRCAVCAVRRCVVVTLRRVRVLRCVCALCLRGGGRAHFTSHISLVSSSSAKLWYFFLALTSSICAVTASS